MGNRLFELLYQKDPKASLDEITRMVEEEPSLVDPTILSNESVCLDVTGDSVLHAALSWKHSEEVIMYLLRKSPKAARVSNGVYPFDTALNPGCLLTRCWKYKLLRV